MTYYYKHAVTTMLCLQLARLPDSFLLQFLELAFMGRRVSTHEYLIHFLLLSSIPLCGQTTSCLFTVCFMDIWVLPAVCSFGTRLLYTFSFKFLCTPMFSFPLSGHSGSSGRLMFYLSETVHSPPKWLSYSHSHPERMRLPSVLFEGVSHGGF